MNRFYGSCATWGCAQQTVSHLMVTWKFYHARLLRPKSIDLVAACMMVLRIAESLTTKLAVKRYLNLDCHILSAGEFDRNAYRSAT